MAIAHEMIDPKCSINDDSLSDELARLRKIEAAAVTVINNGIWDGDDFHNDLMSLCDALKEG